MMVGKASSLSYEIFHSDAKEFAFQNDQAPFIFIRLEFIRRLWSTITIFDVILPSISSFVSTPSIHSPSIGAIPFSIRRSLRSFYVVIDLFDGTEK
jgi:hypothetical protein